MSQTPGTTNYAEIQENEIQVLQSIFMHEFEEQAVKTGAWNKKTERAFTLTLTPPSSPESGLSAVLHVRLPNTYPKTAPICTMEYSDTIPTSTRQNIENAINDITKNMLGQEVIYEFADRIQSELDDTASKVAQNAEVPTLVEERAAQQAQARQREEMATAERLVQQKHAEDEEERTLKLMVESARAKKMQAEAKESFPQETSVSDTAFDITIKLKNREGIIKEFTSISQRTKYRVGPVTTVFTAVSGSLPITTGHSSSSESAENDNDLPFLILKECHISTTQSSTNFKQDIEVLENDLARVQSLPPHDGVCSPLAFRLDKNKTNWVVQILTPFHEKGSLYDLLDTMGTLDVKRIRAWTIQLLEALNFLHRHGINHGRISAQNILLDKNETGGTTLRFCDMLFQRHLHELQHSVVKFSSASSAYWIAPESANTDQSPTAKRDIWDLGIVILQMAFGLDIQRRYNSPADLMQSLQLSDTFEDMLTNYFKATPKKRLDTFQLMADAFFRGNQPLLRDDDPEEISRIVSKSTSQQASSNRQDPISSGRTASRYKDDFVEQGRLGRGGYGEVVRARNKLDGATYAIKKITQTNKSALTDLLGEIMLLSRLNNPYVVRYYTAWMEEQNVLIKEPLTGLIDSSMESAEDPKDLAPSKNSGLDLHWLSSHGNNDEDTDAEDAILNTDDDLDSSEEADDEETDSEDEQDLSNQHDEDDSSHEEDDDNDDDDDDYEKSDDPFDRGEPEKEDTPKHIVPVSLRRRRSSAVGLKVTLYIQMEYCEKQTLRDIINDNLHTKSEECWRLFHQIVEGLVYVHSNGVIHRDLKPENIFISFNQSNTVRIGDFGLARLGEAASKQQSKGITNPQLTASVGTSVYVAPEVKSSGGGHYNEKADMYSLGVILFEMSYPVTTGMERAVLLNDLRDKEPKLPESFDKPLNEEIILSLVKHKVSERPSSQELLQSGKIPSPVEDETIRIALRSLGDKSSPLYTRFVKGLFAQGSGADFLDFAYDMDTGLSFDSQGRLLVSWIYDQMTAVFRRHGAVQVQRPALIPYSPQYYPEGAVQLLGLDGTILQLPFDLTLPFARILAKSEVSSMARKSFTFGHVFREAQPGVHPHIIGEIDFDIISNDSLDIALREAEVIKVMDEIIDAIPSLADAKISYHISHSKLLDAIMAWCKVPKDKVASVKHTLSKLNIGPFNWSRLKSELRAPGIAISSTCLEDLSRFDFCDTYKKGVQRLRSIFQNTAELESTFRHLDAVFTYLNRFRVKRDILLNPFASINEKFYHGNILFQCVHRVAKKKRITAELLFVGGRYDGLIQDLRSGNRSGAQHAVGFNLAWKNVIESMVTYQQQADAAKAFLKKQDEGSASSVKACRSDVLVDSVDPAMLRSSGISLVQELWSNGISAELVIDSDVRESRSHRQQNKDESNHDWIVLIKQDDALKIHSTITKEDTELRSSELVGWLRMELRERDRLDPVKNKPQLRRETSEVPDRDADVSVFAAIGRSKKGNRQNIVAEAQARTVEMSQTFIDSPIVAIELKDDVFEGIRETRLSDPDSWRKYIQSTPLAGRLYLSQLHDLLLEKAAADNSGKGSGMCWLYNFRSRACMMYDLSKASEK